MRVTRERSQGKTGKTKSIARNDFDEKNQHLKYSYSMLIKQRLSSMMGLWGFGEIGRAHV